jgi:DNA-binding transcriptional LysR family regulator
MSLDSEDFDSRVGRRLKLRGLHILFAVARCGSMAKAAAHLNISQPAVSQAIADLESQVRVPLLERNPHGVTPTIYGEAILRRGAQAFDALKEGLREIEYLADPSSGKVSIGCPESLAAGLLPAIIDQLSRRHPRVVFHVAEANSAALEFHALRERSVDLMLGRLPKAVSEMEDVDIEFLYDDPLFVVAGHNSPWARRRRIELAELANEQWIMAPSNNIVRSMFLRAFRERGLDAPRITVESNSMHVRMHLLATGRFLTVLANSLLRQNSERWSLKVLPIDLGVQQLPVAIATLRARVLSPAVKLFIEAARDIAQSITAEAIVIPPGKLQTPRTRT